MVTKTVGEVLITFGLVVLLFVIYEVYITDLISAGKQQDATVALDNEWQAPEARRVEHFDGLGEGEGFAKIYVPVLDADYHFTVLEGTTEKTLTVGPGHYLETAYPGQPGNFAVAGHRVGKGAPFNDIDLISSCDAIIVETRYSWYVYRMLPEKDEIDDWATGKGTSPQCKGVGPLGGLYEGVSGQTIVTPQEGSVISPIPGQDKDLVSDGEMASLLTLTTCHPKFSDKQRLIVHAVLVEEWAKNPDKPDERPAAFEEAG